MFNFPFELKDYQIYCIEQGYKMSRSLIILPPGSGKSAIIYGLINKVCCGPFLIISSEHILLQHKKFIEEYSDFTPFKYDPKKKLVVGEKTIILCTPGLFQKHKDTLVGIPCSATFLDESHLFKNRKSKRAKAAFEIHTLRIYEFTATPCPENVGELQPQIQILDPFGVVGNYGSFKRKFEVWKPVTCGCKSWWEIEYKDESKIIELCKPYILPDKPFKIEMPYQVIQDIVLDMPLCLKKKYEQVKKECMLNMEDFTLFIQSGKWMKLLQIAGGFVIDTVTQIPIGLSEDKQKQVISLIPDLLETPIKNLKDTSLIQQLKPHRVDPKAKIIIWCCFRFEITRYYELLKDKYPCEYVMGQDPNAASKIEKFKTGDTQILITNPKCVGMGVSFEMCHYQIISSLVPSNWEYIQLLGRTNRINQIHQEYVYRVYYKEVAKYFRLVEKKGSTQQEIIEALFTK